MTIQLMGDLFEDVVASKLFPDSKTFVDAIANKDPKEILAEYRKEKNNPQFSLKNFLSCHFVFPKEEVFTCNEKEDLFTYIEKTWSILLKDFKEEGSFSTLISLPYPHIVPGGRFREMYYWDNYFVIEGLFSIGKGDIADKMIKNLGCLIDKFGFIPNGNRTYYLTRSQPPYFSLMIQTLFREGRKQEALHYYPQLMEEYDFWMRGSELLTKTEIAHERVVLINGILLNRYYDESNTPRPEGYKEDLKLFNSSSHEEKKDVYHHIRAACESGWDFSSRWCKDSKNLNTIKTLDILPIDLNCLLYHLEKTLAYFAEELNNEKASFFKKRAHQRKKGILKLLWDKERKCFFDYDFKENKLRDVISLAAFFPLMMDLATDQMAESVVEEAQKYLLTEKGFVATNIKTKMQWDSPYLWPPLQYIAYVALRNYGYDSIAFQAIEGFTAHCERIYHLTGEVFEKYHPESEQEDIGEYPIQKGYGWTNALLCYFKKELDSRSL